MALSEEIVPLRETISISRIMNIKDKKVLIVGFGRSGQAAARYCLEAGAIVTVTDSNSNVAQDFSPANIGRSEDLRYIFGSHPAHIFTNADIIVVSPGVPLDIEPLKAAKKKGVPIVGEMELVLDKIKAPIIAITGTNGKSTVTTLIGEMLKEAGHNVLVGGNLGTPLIELLRTTPVRRPFGGNDERRKTDFVVLEVSSYQLELTPSLHPHVALLLNITPDHLDRYASYEDYINAKALIAKELTNEDFLIYNEGDELVCKIAKGSKAKKIGFSIKNVAQDFSPANIGRSKDLRYKDQATTIDISRAKITGTHNRENIMAASLACEALGCGSDAIQRVIETFKGLPHRNQFVRDVGGVKYYDDSKGTNVGAVVKSLEGFDSKVILIAGGLDKGGSYSPLRPLVKEKVKGLILIGAAKEVIARELGDLTKAVTCDSMAAAVREAAAMAAPGDVVLLSPACASFDMFKDYADRGDRFVDEVRRLKE